MLKESIREFAPDVEVQMVLPCRHEEQITRQVEPTVALLNHMDDWHPDILQQHSIVPADYKGSLVFRSAVESIRGTFIASSTTGRQRLIEEVLENLRRRRLIAGYENASRSERHDFTVAIEREPDYFVALEVKGGEGNSINILVRPIWAREFAVWCHLDGAIVNQPAKGAHSILNRITNELPRRDKLVDLVFFKDMLCGTRARPCPKYPGQEDTIGLEAAPDVFMFPQRKPTPNDPQPPVHTMETLKLPRLILNLFGVPDIELHRHLWEVCVKLITLPDNRYRRHLEVWHQGIKVDESQSRAWRQ